ncbi:MAG: chromosomal replication initiator protein DnaA [Methylacidiphilales bacterium]|nr:chromosomal replication initiator protein DnaA [Candidatus Methylacidiphilales bacterium]
MPYPPFTPPSRHASDMSQHQNQWKQICDHLRQLLPADAVDRWFIPLVCTHIGDKTIELIADNEIYPTWIEENYLPLLKSAIETVVGKPLSVKISTLSPGQPPETPASRSHRPSRNATSREHEEDIDRESINERHRFDNFVVGPNNQFAHAAALAVAHNTARSYNPLFLHGRAGLGKTHLMQAIGNYLIEKKRHLRVRYITCETFCNDFIAAVSKGQGPLLERFRKRYRQVDVLLIDDIQFLAGKDRSQEEFFHTFNALFDGSKQIVITADSPPNEIANLEKRLVSRFEWGLTAELLVPDQETRRAILAQKLKQMQTYLPDEILALIAARISSSIRRLEGALNRVAVYASLHQGRITVAQAENLLKDLFQQEQRPSISIELIQRRVAEAYDVRLGDLTGRRRPAHIALPRQIAMYLARQLTNSSLMEIGDAFGGRDHGTVLHAYREISRRMTEDPRLKQMIDTLVEKLKDA